ncbi:MAG: pyridoxamine 5'-phosphate oxidase family protein [Pseudomonadota bacterium]
MPDNTPDHYDDLEGLLRTGEALMVRGRADRKSPAHTPTLATIGLDGAPRLRTVVLRGFDAEARTARAHTDARAAKVAEIGADPRVSLHAYHAGQKLQVRLQGEARLIAGEAAREVWERMNGFSRRCYFAEPAPGSAVPEPTSGVEGIAPSGEATTEALEAAFAHFTIVEIAYDALEVLYLHADGHRRARVRWDGSRREAVWLVP